MPGNRDPLLERARAVWEKLAGAPVSFASAGELSAVASPGSKLCPRSWVGIVVLGSAAILTVPNDCVLEPVRHALATGSDGVAHPPSGSSGRIACGGCIGSGGLGISVAGRLQPRVERCCH
jgi:hypothetical protein